jgi:arylformamidase
MKTLIQINGRDFDIDLKQPIDISIAMSFNGQQPNAYGVEPATSTACEYGTLVGDTRRNGSCNFEQVTLIPHCNGTHTECVGHITNERISVLDCLLDTFLPAVLVTAEPEFHIDDLVISAKGLGFARPIGNVPETDGALIVRTLPNDDRKLSQVYDVDFIPPYFTREAMEYIVGRGFKHLLVDLPSIDRIFDDGKLSNHRIFWDVEPESFETRRRTRMNSTITELIYVPNDVPDGEYLLNLQIAPFASDAAPSRPILFRVGAN